MKKTFLTFLLVATGLTCWADEFYIVGDATPWGWVTGNLRKPTQMIETDTPGVYEWTGLLKHGGDAAGNGFYICTNLGGWSAIYPSEQYAISEVGETSYQTGTEYKWNPTNTDWQFYTITLNTTEGTISWAAGELFITPDDEGYYNISNAEELYWFSAIVNNNASLKARLTADIDYTAYPRGMIGNRVQNSRRYSGTFDGQEHTVTIDIKNDARDTGLFGVIDGATIKNLVVEGNAESSDKIIGGLGGLSFGNCTIENIVVKTNVKFTGTGDATMGGIFGDMEAVSTVKNCAFYGSFIAPEGENVRGLVSWCSGGIQFSNCLIVPAEIDAFGFDYDRLANGSFTDNNCYRMEPEDEALASGEICYLLNGDQTNIGWYQTLDTDELPVPFSSHSQVYANGKLKCDGTSDGELVYSNSSTSTIPPHTDEGGWCSVCGTLIRDHLIPDAEGYYDIGGPEDLNWFAAIVNEVNPSANARLTDDIDYTDYIQGFIGTGNAFSGTFDGQEHTITIALESNAKVRGLFAKVNGATIRNLIVDGSITSSSYNNIGGLGGQSDGSNTVENVVVKTIINYFPGSGDASIGGFFPYVNSGSTLTLINSAFYGTVSAGDATGNAGLVAWSSGTIQATNCLVAPAEVEASELQDYSRGNRPEITNCFRIDSNDERKASGELCFLLNGKQFRNPVWFQTLDTDEAPLPFPTHGIVISGAEQYFSVFTDEDVTTVVSAIQTYEEDKMADGIIATQALIDNLKAVVEAISDSTTIQSLANAIDELETAKAAVEENKAVYQAYIDKCAEIRISLENDKSFSGALRDALEYYLSDEISEPDEFNTLGTYEYIIENHTATAEEIEAEMARLVLWLENAIAEDYKSGTDVSKLIPNSDFSKQKENWTDAWCNDFGEVANTQTQNGTIVGVEAWNTTGNMYQTVEGMKPGYYLVGVNGAFRPSNMTYSTNYAAGIYANGIFNYFPTVVENYIAVTDTIDQVNCNLHGQGSSDLKVAIYSDFFSTSEEQAIDNGASLLGYGVSGSYGMAAAANAGRYQVYTIAFVGEDGKLTIGIKNPGTMYSSDWTGWGPLKVVYCGNDEEISSNALDSVLVNMSVRAKTIINYTTDMDVVSSFGPAAYPNFPVSLKDSLLTAVNAVEAAETVEAKAELVAKFSDLFQKVYEGKQAYIALFNYASQLNGLEDENLPLVKKDENGEWVETGENVFSVDEGNAFFLASTALFGAFRDGTFSTEEAQNPSALLDDSMAEVMKTLFPEKDEDGFYLISNPKQFVVYRALVNKSDRSQGAKLLNDIDMAGIGMQPFNVIFTGSIDGQGHTLDNVYINYPGQRCALFYELQNATVKNLKLTGEYYSNSKFMGGLTGWTSGNTTIENCEIDVTLHSEVVGDGTHGCVMGVCGGNSNVDVNNCLVNCTIIGPETKFVAGICGWSDGNLTVRNSLLLSQYSIAEAGIEGSDVVARYKYSVENVFYAPQTSSIGTESGKLATEEQLASGEICYKLNGSQSVTPVWFQTLGTDATPHLFDGKIVYCYNNAYTNRLKGDANGDKKVDATDYQYILNIISNDSYNAEADINDSGAVDAADIQFLLNIIANQ